MQIINTQYTEQKSSTPSTSVKQVNLTARHFAHSYQQKGRKKPQDAYVPLVTTIWRSLRIYKFQKFTW